MPFNTSKPGEGNDHAGRELVTSAFVMGFLSCSAVALRFVSRKIQRVPLMHDDWLILAALVGHVRLTDDEMLLTTTALCYRTLYD